MTPARNNIRYYRKKAGLTQKELAKISGVSESTITNLERRGSQPSERVREFLADALHVDEEKLCGYDSPYVSCLAALPNADGDYLCAFKIHPRAPFNFAVLHYSKRQKLWMAPAAGVILNSRNVKWWMDIPKLPPK